MRNLQSKQIVSESKSSGKKRARGVEKEQIHACPGEQRFPNRLV